MIEEISAFHKVGWKFKLHDQMGKINEYNELIESTKQKKIVDIYFNGSQSNFEKNVNKNVPQFMNKVLKV